MALAVSAWAGPETLPETALGAVSVVIDGDTVRIDGVAGDIRLAGILAPQTRPGHDDTATAATQARDGLAALVAGHEVSVRSLPVTTDRDGRVLAHLIRDDGLWLQAELIRRGLARVAVNADTAMFAPDLLALEDEARRAGRGLWSDPAFAVRAAADTSRLFRDAGTFQIVDGHVANASRHGDVIYLDFGDQDQDKDHRDFAAAIPRASWPQFSTANLKPLTLAGRHVRVRGWITRHHGPAMEITHPAMIEVLE
ncbi:MAG: thermonuclease family protein [Rhodospirillaceae bacterium]|nr:MAG: thermonuclease family protein [Rhodospirillaceae bacterium]